MFGERRAATRGERPTRPAASTTSGSPVGSGGHNAQHTGPRTIALLGDSYVFASDVNYEDSWGHRLEQKLGSAVQVLNFGVPGSGSIKPICGMSGMCVPGTPRW